MAITAPNRSGQKGITLIELMIVIVILGILLGVALPAYQAQVIRGNRAAAQAVMLDIANWQQQRFLSDRSYANKAALESAGFSLDPDVARNYSYSITLGAGTVPSYVMTFTPTGQQTKDGNLTLNEQGVGTPAEKWDR